MAAIDAASAIAILFKQAFFSATAGTDLKSARLIMGMGVQFMNGPSREEFEAHLQAMEAKSLASDARIEARMVNLETSVKRDFEKNRSELEGMRAELHRLRTDITKLEGEMHKNIVGLIKWVAGISLTTMLITLWLTFIAKTLA